MRDEEQTQTTVTTSTLELGIDIGRLERAFQIDAPFTVSSFCSAWGAQAVATFRPRCGLSCVRKNLSRAR